MPDEHIIAPTPQALASAPLALARADRTLTDIPFAATIGAAVLLIMVLSAVAGFAGATPHSTVRSARRRAASSRCLRGRSLTHRRGFRRSRRGYGLFAANSSSRSPLRPVPAIDTPTWSDHKKNVEYDVDRVIGVLGNHVVWQSPACRRQVGGRDDSSSRVKQKVRNEYSSSEHWWRRRKHPAFAEDALRARRGHRAEDRCRVRRTAPARRHRAVSRYQRVLTGAGTRGRTAPDWHEPRRTVSGRGTTPPLRRAPWKKAATRS